MQANESRKDFSANVIAEEKTKSIFKVFIADLLAIIFIIIDKIYTVW